MWYIYNIRRAFLQTLWLDSPFLNAMDIQNYGHVCHLNENMILPKLSDDEVKPLMCQYPESVPHVLREHVQFTCRVAGLTCTVFCVCADHEDKRMSKSPHDLESRDYINFTYHVVYFITR